MQNDTSLVNRPRVTAMTEKKAREIIITLWPKAPEEERVKAIILCTQYGLNPLAKHLFLIPYQHKNQKGEVDRTDWSIVWGIKAKRLVAYRRHGGFSYADNTPRLMTEAEEKLYFGEVDKSFLSGITILVDSRGNRYPGYGRWPLAVSPKGLDKGNSKANMCLIRSESQALERYAPGAMPENIEVVDAEFEELPVPKQNVQSVDHVTGEVTSEDIDDDPPIVDEDAPATDTVSQDKGVAPTPATIQELYTWVARHGKNYTPSWIEKSLGVKDTSEVAADIPRAYRGIKEITGWAD